MSKDGKTALWVLAGVMFFSGILNVVLSLACLRMRGEDNGLKEENKRLRLEVDRKTKLAQDLVQDNLELEATYKKILAIK